ncbi:MAG: O-antigen ligase family protein [Clostridiales bacterium]|nr:O-antigen ligase family protein [Clostridiales bacterium]
MQMLLRVLLNNSFFNILIFFINSSISDALFKRFYIHPSLISIGRLFLNLIFIFVMFFYVLTKRIHLRTYDKIVMFILLIGASILITPEKVEAIKVYINFIGMLSYFIILFNVIEKERVIMYLKNYCNLLVILDLLSIFIFKSIGYMENSSVIRGIHLSRSTFTIYLFLCVFVYLYYLYIFYKINNRIKKSIVFMILLSFLLIVISKSSTGVLILVLLFPLMKFIKNNKRLIAMVIASMSFSILIPVLNLNSGFINDAINSVFGKNITFSGRKYIWNYALSHFVNNPIIGNGFNSIDSLFSKKVIPIYQRVAAHSHNGFLEVFLQNGIMGLLLIIIIIFIYFSNIKYFSEFEKKLLASYMILFIVFNSMEPYLLQTVSVCTFWLVGLFIIIYNRRSKEKLDG